MISSERAQALKAVQISDFAAYEAMLYLDGYPDCKEALVYFKEMVSKADKARKYYEEKFGPLTAKENKSDCWLWTQTPWPWELEANV